MKTFYEILQTGCEGNKFRDIIDNLDDKQIIDCVEEYAKQFSSQLEPPVMRIFADLMKLQSDVKVKIKGDAGTYKLYGVDWMNYRFLVDRACGLEWIDYKRCKPVSKNSA